MAPGTPATDPPGSLGAELRRARWRRGYLALSPSVVALVVTVPLVAVYLALEPPSSDLAAATYRGELFARAGFTLWNDGW